MNRLSLKLGLCMSPATGYVDCAFEQSACEDPSDWRSPGVLIGNEFYRGMGDFCLLSGAVKDEVLGRCGDGSGPGRGVGGLCAPNRESCQDSDAGFFGDQVPFETESADCTVEETTFGKCGDRCSWSPVDCGPDEEWTFPAEGCKCDDVRTGGCVRRDGLGILGDVHCAVSGGACDAERGWEWMSPLEMAASEDVDAECYVCTQATAPVPVEEDGALIPVVGSKEGSKEDSKAGSSPPPSVVIGAAVGGSLLVALLASLLITRQFKKRQSKSAEAELKETQSDATTTAVMGMDLKLESGDEDDMVSNLDEDEVSTADVEDLESSDKDEVSNLDDAGVENSNEK